MTAPQANTLQQAGLASIGALALAMGYQDASTVSRWFTGSRVPNARQLVALAVALGTTVDKAKAILPLTNGGVK